MIERLRRFLQSSRGIRLTVLLGLAGIALILFSEMMPKKTEQRRTEATYAEGGECDAETYRISLENRLTGLLARMEGVGAAQVMVTLDGSSEQIYAEEVRVSKGDHNEQKQSAYVITRAGGSESALLSRTAYPDIQGVAVLCAGGGHAAVRERVSRAVAVVLGIPANRVFVGKTVT